MARQEADREDLLAEATALVERVELALAGSAGQAVIGFRRDGCASFYFSAEHAYHFNRCGQLRRAYLDGLLYKARRGWLASLARQRTAQQVQLLRHDLNAAETGELVARLESCLAELGDQLSAGKYKTLRQIPADADVVGRIQAWLSARPRPMRIADSPRAE
jgi:hypothetical protein